VVVGNPRHDQVYALGQQVVITGVDATESIVFVDKGAGRVDQDFRANRESFTAHLVLYLGLPVAGVVALGAIGGDIVRRDATLVHRAAHEIEYETRIVIVQKGVGILDAGFAGVNIDQGFTFFYLRE